MAGSMLVRPSYRAPRLADMVSARPARGPQAPRVSPPDLPREFEGPVELAPRLDLLGARLSAPSGDADAAHAHLAECRLDAASPTRLDLTGATLSDVAATDLRAAELVAREGTWRNVEIAGGRIGTLDGLRVRWDSVTLRDLRIDYLSLPSAELTDVLIVGCDIGTLDVPEARLTRVRFEGSHVDEVDTRGLRSTDLDLRGLEALSFTDARSLSGTWLSERQTELHAAAFAAALGIRVSS